MSAGARPDVHDPPSGAAAKGGGQAKTRGRRRSGAIRYHQLLPVLADAEQSGSPRTGMGSDQEDSKPITLGESGEGKGWGARPSLLFYLGIIF